MGRRRGAGRRRPRGIGGGGQLPAGRSQFRRGRIQGLGGFADFADHLPEAGDHPDE